MRKQVILIPIIFMLLTLLLPTTISLPLSVGNKYAIIFGVAYKTGGASGTDNTARLASWILIHEYGFKSENVKLLLNSQVSYDSMTDMINWIVSIANPEDTIVFFYSGHGAMGYIGTYGNSYSSTELKNRFSNLLSQKALFVIDACYSGSFVEPLSGPNRIVVSSTGFTYAFDGNHYTAFGYTFLDRAMRRGMADLNGDGLISIEEVYEKYSYGWMISDQYVGDMIL